jgi:zinc protease
MIAGGNGIARRVLANGLSVVAERRGLGPVVFAGVVYRVGSRDERPGITGISHLLEHMMFKGTERYAKGEISAIVERNGGELNAFTSEDVTMYYEVFARDRWKLALEIEAERMARLKIDAAELESERQVVLEERVMYLDVPQVELGEELMAATFRESPYRWPIIGWEGDIRAITRDDLLAHYRSYYAPQNAAVIVVGDVDPEEAFARAEEAFGGLPAGDGFARRVPREPELRAATRITLRRRTAFPHLQMLMRAPEVRSRESEAILLLANLLSGSRTARLDMALLETGLAGDVQVHYHAKSDPSAFGISVELQPGARLEEVEEVVWRELERLAAEPASDEELERALSLVEASQVFAMQSPSNRGFALGWHEACGDVHYADAIVERLRSLEKTELCSVAASVFSRERSGTGWIIPDGEADDGGLEGEGAGATNGADGAGS